MSKSTQYAERLSHETLRNVLCRVPAAMPKTKQTNRDHARQHQCPAPDNAVIAAELERLLTPIVFAQQRSVSDF